MNPLPSEPSLADPSPTDPTVSNPTTTTNTTPATTTTTNPFNSLQILPIIRGIGAGVLWLLQDEDEDIPIHPRRFPFRFVARFTTTALVVGDFYPRIAGGLLHALAYLVHHGWYPLAAVSAVVVFGASAAVLGLLEFSWGLFRRNGVPLLPARRVAASASTSWWDLNSLFDDDEDTDWRSVATSVARAAAGIALWTAYCWANALLDYAIFWSQYDTAHPGHNPELFFVNFLMSVPLLIGAAGVLLYQQQQTTTRIAAGDADDRLSVPFLPGTPAQADAFFVGSP